MSRQLNKLTALKVKNLKYGDSKSNKHTDGGGMYLLIDKSGGKYWRLDYIRPTTGKRNTLPCGVYPTISLEAARTKREDAKRLIANGIDPAEVREQNKHERKANTENTFEKVAERWLAIRAHENKNDFENIRRLKKDVYPYIGDKPITTLTTAMLEAEVTNRIVTRGALELARKVRISITQIMDYARRQKLILSNPAQDMTLPRPIRGNYAAIVDPHGLQPLLKAIWTEINPRFTFITGCAIKMSVYIFLRPSEIRSMKWSAYNKTNGTLSIEPLKQSNDQPKSILIVPLAKQAIELLEQLYPLTGHSDYVFYSPQGAEPYLSEGTVNMAIKRLGFAGEQTAHGLRATARTILEEQLDFEPTWIERQLAHKVRDANGESYNRTKHVNNRRIMLQAWADYIGQLKDQSFLTKF